MRFERVHVTLGAPRAEVDLIATDETEARVRHARALTRRNPRSATPVFEEVLVRHRALHDLSKPLVRQELDHAIDTWQWTLRLEEGASEALQIAALFHDVERLVTEADVRIEQYAADYQPLQDAHARAAARLVQRTLGDLVRADVLERVAALIERKRCMRGDAELATLDDADALSFLSIGSGGFLHRYGEAHTRRKIAHSYARLSARARGELATLELADDVAAMLAEVCA